MVLCGKGFFSYILEFQLEESKADSKICKGVLQQDLIKKLWGFFFSSFKQLFHRFLIVISSRSLYFCPQVWVICSQNSKTLDEKNFGVGGLNLWNGMELLAELKSLHSLKEKRMTSISESTNYGFWYKIPGS